MKFGLCLDWPVSGGGPPRMDGGHPETPGRAGDLDTLPGCEESPPAEWGAVVDRGSSASGCPGGPHAGC